MICSIPDCDNKHYAKTWCDKHYRRFLRNGSPNICLKSKEKREPICTVDGCENKHQAKGLCISHYQEKYPELMRSVYGRRRARKKENGAFTVTKKDIRRLLSTSCLLCDKPSEHLDHIIPISRGGRHSVGNLIGLCAFHNQSKHAKLLSEYKYNTLRMAYGSDL